MKRINLWTLLLTVAVAASLSCTQQEKPQQQENTKPKYLWFDCEANYERLSHPDSIDYYLKKASQTGFTDVVVDVKSIMGWTLYDSEYAPYMGEWKGHTRKRDYDMLGIFLDKAGHYGIDVFASMNVFSGGHIDHEKGIIYGEHADWQSMNYWHGQVSPISQIGHTYNGMLNPALEDVQNYEMNIIKEVVNKYPNLEGIVLDRMRYDGITGDFSSQSRKMFEQYLGKTMDHFPEDIIYWKKDKKGDYQWKKGPLFNKWVEWRAKVIHDFARDVRQEIKAINPDIVYGDYTGAWYPTYYQVGVNWASKQYDPSKEYDWATEDYQKTGYAEYLDLYMGGLYFNDVTIEEVQQRNKTAQGRNEPGMTQERAYWYSVEGCADLANEVLKGAAPFMGSIYVDQFKDDKEQFSRAVKMAIKKTDGLMIFDAVHLIDHGWWDEMNRAMQQQPDEQ